MNSICSERWQVKYLNSRIGRIAPMSALSADSRRDFRFSGSDHRGARRARIARHSVSAERATTRPCRRSWSPLHACVWQGGGRGQPDESGPRGCGKSKVLARLQGPLQFVRTCQARIVAADDEQGPRKQPASGDRIPGGIRS